MTEFWQFLLGDAIIAVVAGALGYSMGRGDRK